MLQGYQSKPSTPEEKKMYYLFISFRLFIFDLLYFFLFGCCRRDCCLTSTQSIESFGPHQFTVVEMESIKIISIRFSICFCERNLLLFSSFRQFVSSSITMRWYFLFHCYCFLSLNGIASLAQDKKIAAMTFYNFLAWNCQENDSNRCTFY